MVVITIITQFQIGDNLYNKELISPKMKSYLIVDGIVTIIILLSLVYRELI
jgi:hypothetical protein